MLQTTSYVLHKKRLPYSSRVKTDPAIVGAFLLGISHHVQIRGIEMIIRIVCRIPLVVPIKALVIRCNGIIDGQKMDRSVRSLKTYVALASWRDLATARLSTVIRALSLVHINSLFSHIFYMA